MMKMIILFFQEGILDVSVEFDDGTSMPLRELPPADYFLDMDTLNNHVVAFGPMLSNDQPKIIALGQGRGIYFTTRNSPEKKLTFNMFNLPYSI